MKSWNPALWSKTAVLNIVAILITFGGLVTHHTFSDAIVAQAGLLVWAIVNIVFTEKGDAGLLSVTVIGNGIAALAVVISAISGWTFETAQLGQVTFLAYAALQIIATEHHQPPSE